MAKPPQEQPGGTNPDDFPDVPPRDLYATSDIRFVMLKLGELMAKVDALITTTQGHGDKLDELRHKVSMVKGGLWVLGGLVTVVGLALAAFQLILR